MNRSSKLQKLTRKNRGQSACLRAANTSRTSNSGRAKTGRLSPVYAVNFPAPINDGCRSGCRPDRQAIELRLGNATRAEHGGGRALGDRTRRLSDRRCGEPWYQSQFCRSGDLPSSEIRRRSRRCSGKRPDVGPARVWKEAAHPRAILLGQSLAGGNDRAGDAGDRWIFCRSGTPKVVPSCASGSFHPTQFGGC